MAQKLPQPRTIQIPFPIKGVNVNLPANTPDRNLYALNDTLNVLPYDRGGTGGGGVRPGTVKIYEAEGACSLAGACSFGTTSVLQYARCRVAFGDTDELVELQRLRTTTPLAKVGAALWQGALDGVWSDDPFTASSARAVQVKRDMDQWWRRFVTIVDGVVTDAYEWQSLGAGDCWGICASQTAADQVQLEVVSVENNEICQESPGTSCYSLVDGMAATIGKLSDASRIAVFYASIDLDADAHGEVIVTVLYGGFLNVAEGGASSGWSGTISQTLLHGQSGSHNTATTLSGSIGVNVAPVTSIWSGTFIPDGGNPEGYPNIGTGTWNGQLSDGLVDSDPGPPEVFGLVKVNKNAHCWPVLA